jgi:hypothetical protein
MASAPALATVAAEAVEPFAQTSSLFSRACLIFGTAVSGNPVAPACVPNGAESVDGTIKMETITARYLVILSQYAHNNSVSHMSTDSQV